MNSIKVLGAIITVVLSLGANAQIFVKETPSEPLSFKELQKAFYEWKSDIDIEKEKHWKYFKRMEMEMQFRTNTQGELADPADFLIEASKVQAGKKMTASTKFLSNAWYPVGPFNVPDNLVGNFQNGIGRINSIAFHPADSNTYFIGVAQGGVWKTTNNGQTWIPLTDNLPILRISDIAIDPNNYNVIYISVCDYGYIGAGLFLDGRKRNTHYGLGVYKTEDGGQTWNPTGLSFQQTHFDESLIKEIIINPANSNNVLACGVSGMFSSMDGGVTWTKDINNLFWDMIQHPDDPNTLYAASGWVKTANLGQAGIYKSTDFGLNWTLLNTTIPQVGQVQRLKLAIAPSDPDVVYAIAVNTSNGLYGFYKTINAGANWQFSNPGVNVLEAGFGNFNNGQGIYDLALLVDKFNPNVVYTGGVNIWGSIDGGQTFNPASHWSTNYGATLHGDIHYIDQQYATGKIFVCSDGGLYKTDTIITQTWPEAMSGTPWPTNWTDLSNGLAVTSFYRISSSKDSSGRIIAGSQDNATAYFDGSKWNTIFGGDGMDNFLVPNNPSYILGSSQYGSLWISYNGGFSAIVKPPPFNEAAEWTTPIVLDYNEPGVAYVGYENVFKSMDYGFSWTKLSNFPNGPFPSEISALAVSNSNSDVIYAAKRIHYQFNSPGSVYITKNGGTTWTNITAGLPDSLYYTSIEVSEANADVAYITMAGFSTGNKVFLTNDGGISWQNISYNLPNIPVNVVKYVPGQNAIMVGTDLGIYVLEPSNAIWEYRSMDLPNVIVTDIEFNPVINKVYISTFGRGIWANEINEGGTGIINKGLSELNINLYPSPNKGNFTIKFEDQESVSEINNLEIIDIRGKIVHIEALSGKTEYSLSLNLPSGLYFARISGNRNGVKKFLIN